jgi:transcription initiation factor IIF auxiliary subunit
MTDDDVVDELREKDVAVLEAIRDGATDTYEIRESTSLSNREIDYSLTDKSLAEMGLVEVHRVSGGEMREVQGTRRRVPNAANRVTLTDKGRAVVDHVDRAETFASMSHDDLVQLVQELEDRVETVETQIGVVKKQIQKRL